MNWDNKDEVLRQVSYDGTNLKYVSNRLKDDEYVVFCASENNKKAFNFASDRLKNDTNFVLKLLTNDINICDLINYETLKNCIKLSKNPINFLFEFKVCNSNIYNLLFKFNLYQLILNYLEKTNFSLDYRIDVLRDMDVKELDKFFIKRYYENDYDIEFLNIV